MRRRTTHRQAKDQRREHRRRASRLQRGIQIALGVLVVWLIATYLFAGYIYAYNIERITIERELPDEIEVEVETFEVSYSGSRSRPGYHVKRAVTIINRSQQPADLRDRQLFLDLRDGDELSWRIKVWPEQPSIMRKVRGEQTSQQVLAPGERLRLGIQTSRRRWLGAVNRVVLAMPDGPG